MRLSDFGVVLVQPHVLNRDVLKNFPNAGESLGLTSKDKKMIQIAEPHLEVLHFDCANPMPKHALDILYAKECFAVAYKNADTELRPVELLLRQFVDAQQLPQPVPGDTRPNPVRLDPVMPSLTVHITADEEAAYLERETDDERFARERLNSFIGHRRAAEEYEAKMAAEKEPEPAQVAEAEAPAAEATEGEGEEAAEGEAAAEAGVEGEEATAAPADGEEAAAPAADEAAAPAAADAEEDPEAAEERQRAEAEAAELEAAEAEMADAMQVVEEEPELEEEKIPMEVLPLWTPSNKMGNAALIFLYFRNVSCAEVARAEVGSWVWFVLDCASCLCSSPITSSSRTRCPIRRIWPSPSMRSSARRFRLLWRRIRRRSSRTATSPASCPARAG